MEYIIINDAKLKIICEKEDLAPHGINANTLEYGEPASRKFIECLLEEAKSRLGFVTEKHRILIQLFPDSQGGCEIFISKLELLKNDEQEIEDIHSNISADKKSKCEPPKKIFFFESLEHLLEACKRLSFLPPCRKSSLFYISQTGYYLYFELNEDDELCEYGINTLNEYSFLLEYGEEQNAKEKLPYLKEYAKSICQNNAIEQLARI